MKRVFKTIKIFLTLPAMLYACFVNYLPGDIGLGIRYYYWKKRFKYLGRNVRIETGTYFQNPKFISIDDNTWIDRDVVILGGLDDSQREKIKKENIHYKGLPGEVYIGKNVHIGIGCVLSGIESGLYISDDCTFSAHCKVYAFSHHYKSKIEPRKRVCFGSRGLPEHQCLFTGSVYFGKNTGLAMNCVVLPGTAVLEDCFVKIGSVLRQTTYEHNSVINGNPASVIASRYGQQNPDNESK